MGCDGGTIPRRDELVKNKKKPEERDRDVDLAAKWQYCALSSTRLQMPIVSCALGRLFNKDSVIEFLLKRDSFPGDAADHIRSLKDVIELKLTLRNDCSATDGPDSAFVCPVVGLEMNGKHRFCYLRKCGCVLSERALKEVKSENCHRCASPFDPDVDVVVINGSEEEVGRMRSAIEERRAKAKADKGRSKKRKQPDSKEDDVIRLKGEPGPSSSAGPSRSTDNPLPESVPARPCEDKKKRSIANDPNASEAFKSLFTSHESAKNKPKSNWVTYNPLYF